MKPIKDAWCIQIELNNVCPGTCAYCTRFNRHLRPDQRYNMDPAELIRILAILFYQGYRGKIGIIGGEPTVHPQFEECCRIVAECWTNRACWAGLWTSGGARFIQHSDVIRECFSWIAFNDHQDTKCHHQRMTMASMDVVPDAEFRGELIDNCWVQRIWCPSITPKGVFFCECAAAWDRILDGPGGWPVEGPWLEYGPEQYKDQMGACQLCGMAVPMPADSPYVPVERVSASCMAALQSHGAVGLPDVIHSDRVDREEYQRRIKDWAPGEYTPGRAKGGVE